MNLLLLSPYHSGSHRAWATGYQRHSQHNVTLLTLPGRFWKWRMHGGAVTLARRFVEQQLRPDMIMATDMLDVTTFLALTRAHTAHIPLVLYMHENQLTYPLPRNKKDGPMRRQRGERDFHYVFVNYASQLAADAIWFNSEYHYQSWSTAVKGYLRRFPDYNEKGSVAPLAAKSQVMPVGIEFTHDAPLDDVSENSDAPPLILWNQRWEYDKNPEQFFDTLYAAQAAGWPFRVALCGENFQRRPRIFEEAQAKLGDRVVHAGFAERAQYHALLAEAEIVISTAVHEFFGISILEAIHSRAFPLLPHRLSYPELLPPEFHDLCLYNDPEHLLARLGWAIYHSEERRQTTAVLAATTARYAWSQIAPLYDTAFVTIADTHYTK